MTAQLLLNHTTIYTGNGAKTYVAGETITDPDVQSKLQGQGGILWPATDAAVVAQAAIVQKYIGKSNTDEGFLTTLMVGAAASSASSAAGAAGSVAAGAASSAASALSAIAPNSVLGLRSYVSPNSRQFVTVDGYSTPGDGGGGTFVWNATDTRTDDGGTILAVTGVTTGRWNRVFIGAFSAKWYGAKGDGVTDDTSALQAAINGVSAFSTIPGRVLYLPPGTYVVSSPLSMPQFFGIYGGIVIQGDELRGDTLADKGTRILSNLPTYSGIDGTITSVTVDSLDGLATIVTLTSATNSFGAAAPGDTIVVSNGNSDGTNGFFTIITASPGSITYYGLSNRLNVVPIGGFLLPNASDAHNGSLHFTVYKPLLKMYTRDTTVRHIAFRGANKTGALVDSTAPGANCVAAGPICSNNHFINCVFADSVYGVKIGDFSGWVAGSATLTAFPANCEEHRFEDCRFYNQTSCVYIPNTTLQSKFHTFLRTQFITSQYGIHMRSGSFQAIGCGSTAMTVADMMFGPVDTCKIDYWTSENAARFLVLGEGIAGSAFNFFPVAVTSCRCDTGSASLSPDGYFIQSGLSGGLTIQSCEFSCLDTNRWTIALAQGEVISGARDLTRNLGLTIEGTILPSSSPATAVTSIANNHAWWWGLNNVCTQGTTALSMRMPNGLLYAANVNPATPQVTPPFQLPILSIPNAAMTLANGTNDVTNPYCSSVVYTAPTSPVILNSIGQGDEGQELKLTFHFNQQVTLKHNGTVTGTQAPILTPTGQDVVIAPSATYSVAALRYVSSLSAWIVTGISPGTTAVTTVNLVNGDNDSIPTIAGTDVIAIGPTGAYGVKGFAAGIAGQRMRVKFNVNQSLTVRNNSSAAMPVLTGTGADAFFQAPGGFIILDFWCDGTNWNLV